MATAGSILQNVRVQVGDPDRDFLTDTIGFEWLDAGQQRFCHEVLPLDEFQDISVTARQKRYDLATDCIIPMSALWFKSLKRRLDWADPAQWDRYEVYRPDSLGNPTSYSIIRRQLVVGPCAPSGDSATALASGDFSSTATTIGFTAASGTFRTRGWLKNQTTGEVVEYTNIATTTVTGCTRGVHGTSGATVASGTQWKEIDLQLRYRKSPAVITASTQSPEIPAAFHRYLEHYLLFLAWRARGDKAKADAAYNQFSEEEARTKDTIGRRAYEPRAVKDRKYRSGNWNGQYGDGM